MSSNYFSPELAQKQTAYFSANEQPRSPIFSDVDFELQSGQESAEEWEGFYDDGHGCQEL